MCQPPETAGERQRSSQALTIELQTKGIGARMVALLALILLSFTLPSIRSLGADVADQASESICFENGKWFDGEQFQSGSRCTAHGVFLKALPDGSARSVDLEGGYVIPPFGDAHNHNFQGGSDTARTIHAHLADGVFYVKNLNNLPAMTDKIADQLNHARSVDVTFANGGLTSSGGHVVALHLRLVSYGVLPKDWTVNDLDGQAFTIIDGLPDLETKWASVLDGRPDFIKVYLQNSEEFEKRRDDPAYNGRKGLDPALLPSIVARAHAADLSVSVHINTAADFRTAVEAGADEIAHLPGVLFEASDGIAAYKLTKADAVRAARAGIRVTTTAAFSVDHLEDPKQRRRLETEILLPNLRLLQRHGVELVMGSDIFRDTSKKEAFYLSGLGIFSTLDILKMWCETTPRAIFPQRKIGRLEAGFEASFLVLAENPLANFSAVSNIRHHIKQGVVLDLASLDKDS
ncbi:MAG: amidohydrolase family protein [Acidobacteria bacterium]|nr:amidohydrolase family protein [Acidobacteriota bacterium]